MHTPKYNFAECVTPTRLSMHRLAARAISRATSPLAWVAGAYSWAAPGGEGGELNGKEGRGRGQGKLILQRLAWLRSGGRGLFYPLPEVLISIVTFLFVPWEYHCVPQIWLADIPFGKEKVMLTEFWAPNNWLQYTIFANI